MKVSKLNLKTENQCPKDAVTQKTVHELQVHEAELEMQNGDLLRVQEELEFWCNYAEDIVNTVREPLVVLNSALQVQTANSSFYATFKVTPKETIGKFIYDLGNRQWDIPKLRVLFEEILPHDTVINDYEVEHDFLGIGRKVILLNAREIHRASIASHIILLALEDITDRRRAEDELNEKRQELEELNTSLEVRIEKAVDALRQKDQKLIHSPPGVLPSGLIHCDL